MVLNVTFRFYLPITYLIGVMIKQLTPESTAIEIWDGSNSWQIFHTSSSSEYGIWKQYTITWNHIRLKIFVDGVLTVSTSSKKPSTTFLDKSVKANQLVIGTHSKVGSRSTQMEMYFDDLMIWESYLADQQVMSQYKSGEVTTRTNFALLLANTMPIIPFLDKHFLSKECRHIQISPYWLLTLKAERIQYSFCNVIQYSRVC